MSRLERAARGLVHDVVGSGRASAAAALTGDAERILAQAVAGRSEGDAVGELSERTRFDLASLTKPVTATLALVLEARGEVELTTPLRAVFPTAGRELAGRSLEDLLRHRSGLQAWTPLYARCSNRGEAEALLLSGALGGAPAGTYSDLGYILWGFAVERALGRPLAELLRTHVVEPLGIDTMAGVSSGRDGVAACCLDTDREVELAAAQGLAIDRLGPPPPGTVQDGNARFLGGLAGHAGLFASPAALWRLAREWLLPGRLLDRSAVEQALGGGGPFALGWGRKGTFREAGDRPLGEAIFGHLGFTGGSCWVDPSGQRVWVLLAHRSSLSTSLAADRAAFHALASHGMGGGR